MLTFKKNKLIIVNVEPDDIMSLNDRPEFQFTVGTYKLWGLVPAAGKQISEYLDSDYINSIYNKASTGCMTSAATLIWLNSFNCHYYKGSHVEFARIGLEFDKPTRSHANKSRYKAQMDVMVNCLDRSTGIK